MKADLYVGEIRGLLTLIREVEPRQHFRHDRNSIERTRQVECQCKCGNKVIIDFKHFRKDHTKSCGCFSKTFGINKTHGLSRNPLYIVWLGIKGRCYNPKYIDQYKNYGAKGVRMCEEWFNNFDSFKKWAMDNGWKKGLHIDKDIKGTGLLYSPENCIIVPQRINLKYKKNTIMVEYGGKKISLSDLSELIGIKHERLYERYYKGGWPVEKLIRPVKVYNRE